MQATEKKSINKIWLAAISVIAVAALILGIVALVNHGDTKANAIPTINQQVDNIKNTLPELEAVSTELKGYIDTLETTTEKLQSDLTATNTAIDTLKKELGDDIDENEQALLDKLTELKTTIEGQIADITTSLQTLAKNDEQLGKNITDLKNYVDTGLQGNKDWANATFSTLEQYEATQTTIAGIKQNIEDINADIASIEADVKAQVEAINKSIADLDAELAAEVKKVTDDYTAAIGAANTAIETAYTADIKAAVESLEAKMTDWVNEKLEQPLKDIADLQAALSALTNEVATDEELAAAVEAQQKALDNAVAALKEEYKAAITTAINDNNAIIDGKIAAAVAAAKNELQAKIDLIQEQIDDLFDRVTKLENRIQSITFIPGSYDGKVLMDYTARTVTLDFIVSPSAMAQSIETAFDRDNSTIKAYVRYTSDPVNRGSASAKAVQQIVNSVDLIGSDGMFMLTIGAQGLSDDFWIGNVEAVIYIEITDASGNNIVSDAIPMTAHNYAANTNTIGGFGEGANQNGQVS